MQTKQPLPVLPAGGFFASKPKGLMAAHGKLSLHRLN